MLSQISPLKIPSLRTLPKKRFLRQQSKTTSILNLISQRYVLNPTKDFVHLQNFKINNPYSEEKTDKFFYQCSIYLLSFDHKSRRGRKSHLKKQSHRKSLLPPEITLLKSQKNFQSQAWTKLYHLAFGSSWHLYDKKFITYKLTSFTLDIK